MVNKERMVVSRVQLEGDGVYFVFNVILRTIHKKDLAIVTRLSGDLNNSHDFGRKIHNLVFI